jgi:hypothetical protein
VIRNLNANIEQGMSINGFRSKAIQIENPTSLFVNECSLFEYHSPVSFLTLSLRTLFMKSFKLFLLLSIIPFVLFSQSKALVFQTDFGLKDGAVSAMKGVAYGVSPEIDMFDLTHEIPPYNIWEAGYIRLLRTGLKELCLFRW